MYMYICTYRPLLTGNELPEAVDRVLLQLIRQLVIIAALTSVFEKVAGTVQQHMPQRQLHGCSRIRTKAFGDGRHT